MVLSLVCTKIHNTMLSTINCPAFIDYLLKHIGSFFAITGVSLFFYTVVSAILVVHNLTLEEGATGEICVNLTQPPDTSITVIVTSVDGLAQSTTYLC